jgi:hypothetical protein
VRGFAGGRQGFPVTSVVFPALDDGNSQRGTPTNNGELRTLLIISSQPRQSFLNEIYTPLKFTNVGSPCYGRMHRRLALCCAGDLLCEIESIG